MQGIFLPDVFQPVNGLGPQVPSTSATDIINLANVLAIEVVIYGLNTASGVTGSAITLNQAQDVSNTNGKALAFTTYYSCVDPLNSSVFALQTAVSNTFTMATTASRNLIYRIPVDPSTLDFTNGFHCLSVLLATAVNCTVSCNFNVFPTTAARRPSSRT